WAWPRAWQPGAEGRPRRHGRRKRTVGERATSSWQRIVCRTTADAEPRHPEHSAARYERNGVEGAGASWKAGCFDSARTSRSASLAKSKGSACLTLVRSAKAAEHALDYASAAPEVTGAGFICSASQAANTMIAPN